MKIKFVRARSLHAGMGLFDGQRVRRICELHVEPDHVRARYKVGVKFASQSFNPNDRVKVRVRR